MRLKLTYRIPFYDFSFDCLKSWTFFRMGSYFWTTTIFLVSWGDGIVVFGGVTCRFGSSSSGGDGVLSLLETEADKLELLSG